MATPKDRYPCSGVEGCRLRYLKFRCRDEAATIEFYQTLGMSLEGRVQYGRDRAALRFAYRTSSAEFNDHSVALLFETFKPFGLDPSAGAAAETKAGKANDEPKETGSRASSPIGRTKVPAAPAAPAPPQPKAGQPAAAAAAAVASNDNSLDGAAEDVAALDIAQESAVIYDKNRPRDYLVIYVHFLRRLIKRLAGKGFRPLLEMRAVLEILYAVYLDPNGVEVRLMEVPDAQLGEVTNKAQWFARLGYYVMHVVNSDEARHYLESLFSKQHRTQTMIRALQMAEASNATPEAEAQGTVITPDAAGKDPTASILTPRSLHQQPAAVAGARRNSSVPAGKASLAERYYHREGVRLVDKEDIITGLQQTKYVWMGNASREKMCTLALCTPPGFAVAATGLAMTRAGAVAAQMPRSHRLVAIGIELGVMIDMAVGQILREAPDGITFLEERIRNHEYGLIVRARGIFGMFFELTSHHDPVPQTVDGGRAGRKRGAAAQDDRADRPEEKPYVGTDVYIAFNQKLRNSYSDGALCYIRKWECADPFAGGMSMASLAAMSVLSVAAPPLRGSLPKEGEDKEKKRRGSF